MSSSHPTAAQAIQDAIDALTEAEKLLATLDRSAILERLDAFRAAEESLRDAVDRVPQVTLDLRISRLRLQAALPHDPDKTPVEGISSASLRRIER